MLDASGQERSREKRENLKIKNIMKFLLVLSIFLLTLFVSCKTGYKVQTFQFVPRDLENSYYRRSITIQNDTTIRFFISYGGLGSSNSAKYVVNGNEIIVDTMHMGQYLYEIFGYDFIRYKDSLVNRSTNDLYYSNKYYAKKPKKKIGTVFFIIIDDKKVRLTSFNYKRILRKIEFENEKYDFVEITMVEARRLYNIKEKYKTFRLTPKQQKEMSIP